jgi:hypothetical protein
MLGVRLAQAKSKSGGDGPRNRRSFKRRRYAATTTGHIVSAKAQSATLELVARPIISGR